MTLKEFTFSGPKPLSLREVAETMAGGERGRSREEREVETALTERAAEWDREREPDQPDMATKNAGHWDRGRGEKCRNTFVKL